MTPTSWSYLTFNTTSETDEPTVYTLGDVAFIDEVAYTCLESHEASPLFRTDFLRSRWRKTHRPIMSQWRPNELYSIGDNLQFGHIPVTCVWPHESSSFIEDYLLEPAYFNNNKSSINRGVTGSTYQPVLSVITGWVTATYYDADTILINGADIWIATKAHTSSANTEPGIAGELWRACWRPFKLWIPVTTRKFLTPEFIADEAFYDNYLEACDINLTNRLDFPIVELQNLRNLSPTTHEDILKQTAIMLGFSLQDYSSNLIDPASLYRLVSSLTKYRRESGTWEFVNFFNFILRTDIGPKWRVRQLYTRFYDKFLTGAEVATLTTLPNPSTDPTSIALYVNDPAGPGYYLTSHIELYRMDDTLTGGVDLELETGLEGITKIFYDLAPAHLVIYVKHISPDLIIPKLFSFWETNPTTFHSSEACIIPFLE